MLSISLEKPSSSNLSASSRTSVVRFGALTPLYSSSNRSCNLPGVPTRMWQPSLSVFCNIDRLLFPPTATWTLKSVLSHSFSASTAICSASSRVGDMMMARISDARAREYRFRIAKSGLCRRIFWIVGIRNPRVFPVPVRACATLWRSAWELESARHNDLHISALKTLVDRHRLDIRHGVMSHPLGDCLNDIGMNHFMIDQLLELRHVSWLMSRPWFLRRRPRIIIFFLSSSSIIPQLRRHMEPPCLQRYSRRRLKG